VGAFKGMGRKNILINVSFYSSPPVCIINERSLSGNGG
jgi:hypothetical protein